MYAFGAAQLLGASECARPSVVIDNDVTFC